MIQTSTIDGRRCFLLGGGIEEMFFAVQFFDNHEVAVYPNFWFWEGQQ